MLLTSQERKEAKIIRQIIFSATKPVFVEEMYYMLPWISNQYPSEVIEWTSHTRVKNCKFIASLEKRIKQKYYAEAFVFEGEGARLFHRLGYKRLGDNPGNFIHFMR